jgi:hypothetical protein
MKTVHKGLNLRRQKKCLSWSKLYSYLTLYLLPLPKIKHNFYTLSHKFVRYTEEPYEENLQVRYCDVHYATSNYKLNLNKKEGRNVYSTNNAILESYTTNQHYTHSIVLSNFNLIKYRTKMK